MINAGFGVSLGPLEHADMALIRKWRNDYRIWAWCRQNDVISDVEQDKWFRSQSEDQTIKMYMIYGPNAEKAGVCGLTSIDRANRRAEFSLYVNPDMHGSGYGKAALKTLFTHGFKNLGLHLIWGECFEDNRAREMFKSLGMKEEGMRRDFYFKGGKFVGAYLYGITEDEWRSLALASDSARQ